MLGVAVSVASSRSENAKWGASSSDGKVQEGLPSEASESTAGEADSMAFDFEQAEADPTIVSPDVAPRDVVSMQVEALQRLQREPEQALRVFSLASPQNRLMTGPLPRFYNLLLTEPYRRMVFDNSSQIGEAVVVGDQAHVLVTVSDGSSSISAFRFWLTRQTDAPYQDCWMTDGVEPITQIDIVDDQFREDESVPL